MTCFTNNYYIQTMIHRIAFIVGLISSLLLFVGCVLITFDLPGSDMMLLFGASCFCLIFVPILIFINFKRQTLLSIGDKWVFAALHLMGISFIIGILLKLMNMSCSAFFIKYSLMALIFLILPVYFISALSTKLDEFYTEKDRKNRIIVGVIILTFVGFLYAMIELF